jgi:hypothetical protein
LAAALALLPVVPAAAEGPAAPQGPVTPYEVTRNVSGYTLTGPYIYPYLQSPGCAPGATDQKREKAEEGWAQGGLLRPVYDAVRACNTPGMLSNVVADATHLYWVGPNGLVRQPLTAAFNDPPQLVNALIKAPAEIEDAGEVVLAVHQNTGPAAAIVSVTKATGQYAWSGGAGGVATDLQWDGEYLYYLSGGVLYRHLPNAGQPSAPIATGATGFFAEGRRSLCGGGFCILVSNVFVAQGRRVVIYNNINGQTSQPVYESASPQALVGSLTVTPSDMFLLERRPTTCGDPICPPVYQLIRTRRNNGDPPAPADGVLHGTNAVASALGKSGALLFWREGVGPFARIQRLPQDADALTQVNMRVTGLEVTQAVQYEDNRVFLVQDKRTFVRAYVKADSFTPVTVPGVTALLYGKFGGGSLVLGPLAPANATGSRINVVSYPTRHHLDNAFLFELPWEWTTRGPVQLEVRLNPYQLPPEPDYSDNVLARGPFSFRPSPRFQFQLVAFAYALNNTTYAPRPDRDVAQALSYIRRSYPLSSRPGGPNDAGTGLRAGIWNIFDANLGERVFIPDWCKDPEKAKGKAECSNMRASAYANARLVELRSQAGLPSSVFMYGMISDGAGYFPRGQEGGNRASSGPTGSSDFGWDFDGSYGDWYAAHEVGHSLGRAHPNPGSDDPATPADKVIEGCGHSRSDPNFPYPGTVRSPIGPQAPSLFGFDAGDPSLGLGMQLMPDGKWNDFMGYCSWQWASDYTYKGLYDAMISASAQEADSPIASDFLRVNGLVAPGGASATFVYMRRSDLGPAAGSAPGDLKLRLVGAAGNTLAEYGIRPEPVEDGEGTESFGTVVPFVPGAREVRLVRLPGGQILAAQAISANLPQVSGLALPGAPNPATGVIALTWNATDPDGDTLTYDVLFSRDGGATYRPLQLGVGAKTARVDTAVLGGGSARLRVVASDGVNSAAADIALTVASKAPAVRILSPANGEQVPWGQTVNFVGEATDLQDAALPVASVTWENAAGQLLGNGTLLSLATLPVGSNVITLRAVNSQGREGSANVTVIVERDAGQPGPTLVVSPSALGWQVGPGATETPPEQVIITNAGTGSLGWTAAAGAPWVLLERTAGQAPDLLLVRADPNGRPAGTALTSEVIITPGAGGASVSIPVSLVVGRPDHMGLGGPSPVPPRKTYLPAARK